jgi:DNA-binding transcriptional LysR family regulator
MRFMHNGYGHHASRETTTSRFEPPDYICRDCGGEKHYCGRIPAVLSHSAVSRALQRARTMFQDDLLVRSPQGFELTLRGRKILQELEGLLPKMENPVTPSLFDPMREKSHFRISGPDNVCTVVLPHFCRQHANGRYQVQFEFIPWQSGIAELVEHGQVDLVLHIDDGLLPSHFQSERLYREDWISAVARGSRFGDRLSLIISSTWRRTTSSYLRTPVCRQSRTRDRELRLVKAPHQLHPFHFLMAWHPRLNTDPRHVWLREAMRSTTAALHG